MPYIERKKYLNRLKGLKNTPDIKIITGIRRFKRVQDTTYLCKRSV